MILTGTARTGCLACPFRRSIARVPQRAQASAGTAHGTCRGYLVPENPWLQLQGRQDGSHRSRLRRVLLDVRGRDASYLAPPQDPYGPRFGHTAPTLGV